MRMKYYSPLLYVGVNELLVDFEKLEEDEQLALELKERINDEQWDKNCKEFWEFVKGPAPQLVRDFYDQVGSLHDASFRFVELTDKRAVIEFRGGYHGDRTITLTLDFEKYSKEQVFPESMQTDFREFLYDEFHFENGILSYHFFGTDGWEHSFDGVDIKWIVYVD